jgi:hypothetical protein
MNEEFKMKRYVILVLVLLSISTVLFGQYDEQFSLNLFKPEIIDARAEALGRTSIFSSTGANYIFNNPAMLSDLTAKNIQISCLTKFGKSVKKIKLEEYNYNGKDVTNYLFNMKLNGLAFSMPYTIKNPKELKLGFGFGYRTYYDRGFNKHAEDILSGIHVSSGNITFNKYNYDYISHGGFNVLVFGGGLKYQEKFYGGLSFSFPFYSNISSEYEDSEEDKYEIEKTMKGSFFTFGFAFNSSKKITLGFRLRSGFILDVEEEYENNEGYEYESDYEYIIPSEIGLAVELKPINNVKFYAEYLTRFLGDYKIEIPFNDFYLYEKSNNGFSFRTGLEVGTTSLLRCGFFIQSVPLYERKPLEVGDGYILDKKPQNELGFTTGFGIIISTNLTIDLYGAYSYLDYDESYYDHGGYEVSNEYSYKHIKLGLTTGYNF